MKLEQSGEELGSFVDKAWTFRCQETMAETTHTAWRRERFREQQDPFFSIFFCSIRRPYITFKLPRRDKDTPLRLCNLPDLRRLGCVTSAHLEWPVWSSSSGNNCHAVHKVTLFRCIIEVGPSPCPILSAERTRAISFDYWPLGCVASAIFGIAGVIIIERK